MIRLIINGHLIELDLITASNTIIAITGAIAGIRALIIHGGTKKDVQEVKNEVKEIKNGKEK